MGRAKLILAAGAAVTLLATAVLSVPNAISAVTERRLLTVDTMTAGVINEPDWCDAEVEVAIRADTAEKFRGDRRELQRMLGRVRGIMQLECPAAKTLRLTGLVDGIFVYDGIASEQGGWILLETPALLTQQYIDPPPEKPAQPTPPPPIPQAPAVTQAQTIDQADECDRLAAHPDDPEKPQGAAGVADDAVNTASAIAACTQALAQEPDDARLKFQLARAYLFEDRNAEAIDLLVSAAEDGYGVALAYLGDIMLYGGGGIESEPEVAKSLYQHAAAAGFLPAEKLAAEIVADAQPDPDQEKQQAIVFRRPEFIKALSAGQKPGNALPWDEMIHYVIATITGVREHCPAIVPDRDWANEFMRAAYSRYNLFELSYLGSKVNAGGMDQFMQDGMDDGYGLAISKGCDAVETKNLVKTSGSYL